VKRLFGADNAWDVVEEVLIRYFQRVAGPLRRGGRPAREKNATSVSGVKL
jgi:hypothetical protein